MLYRYYKTAIDFANFIPAASRFSASFTSRTTRLMLWPNLLRFLDAPIAPAANRIKNKKCDGI